jgi:putative ABC transport system permease protein
MIARWTFKALFREPRGLLGSAAAIAAAYTLVMLFEAVWVGESRQVVAYVQQTDADVWVMQKGVSNLHMATSLLADWKAGSVARVPGVAAVTPIGYTSAMVQAGSQNWLAYVVGLWDDAPRGGPWAMAAGRSDVRPGGVILPAQMARLAGLGLGDDVRVADRTFTVTGLSHGTFSMANPVAFVHASDLHGIAATQGFDNYLLVKAAPGVDPTGLAQAIGEQVEKVSAVPRGVFIRNDYRMAIQMGVELVRLLSGIGAALAVLLVAFTLYTHVHRQRRELAVVKALGFGARHIYATVGLQALLVSVFGFVLSLLLAQGAIALAAWLAPRVSIQITGAILARVGLGGLLIALLATLIPARQIARIDPQTAFQS